MRIENNLRTGQVGSRNGARSGGSGPAFQIADSASASRAAATAPAAPTTGIDALLALQAAGDPMQGRRRQVRRARSLLDTLEAMKADLLSGQLGEGRLNQLLVLLAQAREETDPALDGVLDEIEMRARVELAKRGIFPDGASR